MQGNHEQVSAEIFSSLNQFIMPNTAEKQMIRHHTFQRWQNPL